MADGLAITLIILAILGFFNAGYLIIKRNRKKPLVCPIGGHCEAVTESKYSKTLGIKNDLVGAAYYLIILALAIYTLLISTNLFYYMAIISGVALLFSIYLVYVQARVLKMFCFYCLISAGINILIFINTLII